MAKKVYPANLDENNVERFKKRIEKMNKKTTQKQSFSSRVDYLIEKDNKERPEDHET